MNSSSLTLAAIFLFLMTLTSHACGCTNLMHIADFLMRAAGWGGEVWANAATDAVAAWPGFYIFWVYHNQGAATSGSRNRMLPRWSFMVFAALSVVSFCTQ